MKEGPLLPQMLPVEPCSSQMLIQCFNFIFDKNLVNEILHIVYKVVGHTANRLNIFYIKCKIGQRSEAKYERRIKNDGLFCSRDCETFHIYNFRI